MARPLPRRAGRRQQQRRPRKPVPPAQSENLGDGGLGKGKGNKEELSPKITGLPTGLSVTWLGTSSGAPTTTRNVSSIACRFHHATYLVDCGEGTQTQLIKSDIYPGHIKRIFITHLHGDHCFGLPGLLNMISTVRQYSWTGEPVHVYGPPGLEELLKMSLPHWYGRLYMPVHVTEFTMDASLAHEPRPVVKGKKGEVTVARMAPTTSLGRLVHRHLPPFQVGNRGLGVKLREGVLEGHQWVIPCEEGITVTAAQLQHRVPCWGYIMSEEEYIPSDWEVQLEKKRREKQRAELPDPPPGVLWVDPDPGTALRVPGRKVVLLGDTCNSDALAQAAYGADLVSHEATFAKGMEEKAEVAQHSTAVMAGEFARKIGAKQLVLTHFSPRYQQNSSSDSSTISRLVEEAKQGFRSDNVVAAQDFFTFDVPKRRPNRVSSADEAMI
ncbi:unnamed protein product [Ostreobium quekettii]|uniref:Uncharacterized protein n=1 Tax=Ostreobium quekettii TaxID=121088 RepID=A0A8S1J2F0_9CHLO|nr:unnamed protein product [Ostreobium quekettii]